MVEVLRRYVWTELDVWTNAAKQKQMLPSQQVMMWSKLIVELFRQCVWTELDVWPNAVEPASYDVINTDGWSI